MEILIVNIISELDEQSCVSSPRSSDKTLTSALEDASDSFWVQTKCSLKIS